MGSIHHTVLSGITIGILFLATLGFFIRLFLGNRDSKLADSADIVAYWSAIVGTLLALFTGLSGYFLTWPQEAIQNTLLAQNKTLAAVALLVCFGMFILIRWRVGKDMWRSTPLKIWSAILVGFGFINTALLGSMGGSATLAGTALDPALISLNINRFVSLSWGPVLSVAAILLGIGAAVYGLMQSRKRSTV
jgi:hypothetical protein